MSRKTYMAEDGTALNPAIGPMVKLGLAVEFELCGE